MVLEGIFKETNVVKKTQFIFPWFQPLAPKCCFPGLGLGVCSLLCLYNSYPNTPCLEKDLLLSSPGFLMDLKNSPHKWNDHQYFLKNPSLDAWANNKLCMGLHSFKWAYIFPRLKLTNKTNRIRTHFQIRLNSSLLLNYYWTLG